MRLDINITLQCDGQDLLLVIPRIANSLVGELRNLLNQKEGNARLGSFSGVTSTGEDYQGIIQLRKE